MNSYSDLKSDLIYKIFGKVEVETMIKKIKGQKLKQTEKNYLSRSIRPKLRAINFISSQDILKRINTSKKINETDYAIEYNLGIYGFSFISLKKKRCNKILIEDLIAKILIQNPKPRYIEAIPIILLKNKINKLKLIEIATKYDIKNKIGYLLEIALMISKKEDILEIYSYLEQNKDENWSQLVNGDHDFLMKTSPSRVKKWKLLGRFYDEDFKKLAEVYL